jgi:hypothetical protein
MLNRFSRLHLVAAVSAFLLVAALTLSVVPDATAKPCPPPTTDCPNCRLGYPGPGDTYCYLIDCVNCGRTLCRYECF